MDSTESETTDQRFAAGVRHARERAGLSQGALAARLADHGPLSRQQTISDIESGQRSVSIGEAVALAKALAVSVESLTRPEGVAHEGWAITEAKRDLQAALAAMDVQHRKALSARQRLERAIRSAERKNLTETLAQEIRDGRRMLEREF